MTLRNINRYMNPLNDTETETYFTRHNLEIIAQPLHLETFIEDMVLVFEHENKENLFPHMRDLCIWYKQKVESLPWHSKYIRLVHHMPNYIAWLSNKTDCEEITDTDVSDVTSLLATCVGYYTNYTFLNCKKNKIACNSISEKCRVHDYIQDPQNMATIYFNIFHFLAGTSLQINPKFLEMTSVAAVVNNTDDINKNLFDVLYENELTDISEPKLNGVKVVAYTMWKFKRHLFQKELFFQCFYVVISIASVVLLTWLYSGSLLIGITTFTCILFSMIISYFVYGRIYDMNFFPFLNINTLIFTIGVGADDVFLYTQIWKESKMTFVIKNKEQHIKYLIKWTNFTLRRSIIAMLATSLTTSASFFANMTSSVTALKCFGLFTGTSIIVNYLLMFTYLPCVFIIHERYLAKCMNHCSPSLFDESPQIHDTNKIKAVPSDDGNGILKRCEDIINLVVTKHLPNIICRLKIILMIILLSFGVGGIIATFHKPSLKPPEISSVQLFVECTPMEQYDLYYRAKFDYGQKYGHYPHQIYFVFGIANVDNGNEFDPDDIGTLEFKKPLDILAVQKWLRHFCEHVRNSKFYLHSKSCSQVESIFQTLTLPCKSKECCGKTLPFTNEEFLQCFKLYLWKEARNNTSGIQVIFDETGKTIKSLVLPVMTKYVRTTKFEYNERVTKELEDWTQNEMDQLPSDTLKGWWIGEFSIFDLQNSLYTETEKSIGKFTIYSITAYLHKR